MLTSSRCLCCEYFTETGDNCLRCSSSPSPIPSYPCPLYHPTPIRWSSPRSPVYHPIKKCKTIRRSSIEEHKREIQSPVRKPEKRRHTIHQILSEILTYCFEHEMLFRLKKTYISDVSDIDINKCPDLQLQEAWDDRRLYDIIPVLAFLGIVEDVQCKKCAHFIFSFIFS